MSLIPNNERLIIHNTGENAIRERLTESDFNHSSFSIPEARIHMTDMSPYILNRHNAINEGDLVFIEMKIENKNEYMIVNMIYIDTSTYEEVTRTYKCSVSITKENYLSLSQNESATENMNIKLENMGAYTETRKQL